MKIENKKVKQSDLINQTYYFNFFFIKIKSAKWYIKHIYRKKLMMLCCFYKAKKL